MAQTSEMIQWRCLTTVHKYTDPDAYKQGDAYDLLQVEGNLLVYGGASVLWHRLIGGTAVTSFNAVDAHIGVGNSTTPAAAGQTDLQATTNKIRKGMQAGFPAHTEGVTAGSQTVEFKALFSDSEANWAWNEWGLFNAASGGRMLNRKVQALGTKANPGVWTLTIALSLA